MIRTHQKKLIKKQVENQIMIASAVALSCVAFLVLYRLLNRAHWAAEENGDETDIILDEDIGVFEDTGASENTSVPENTSIPEDTGVPEDAGVPENPGISEDAVISEDTEVY